VKVISWVGTTVPPTVVLPPTGRRSTRIQAGPEAAGGGMIWASTAAVRLDPEGAEKAPTPGLRHWGKNQHPERHHQGGHGRQGGDTWQQAGDMVLIVLGDLSFDLCASRKRQRSLAFAGPRE
jgi:hypothetical protein